MCVCEHTVFWGAYRIGGVGGLQHVVGGMATLLWGVFTAWGGQRHCFGGALQHIGGTTALFQGCSQHGGGQWQCFGGVHSMGVVVALFWRG